MVNLRSLSSRKFLLLLAPSLSLIILLLVCFWIIIYYSVLTFQQGFIYYTFTLHNYLRFLTDTYYLTSFLLTLFAGVVVSSVDLILGFPCAYYITKVRRGRGFLLALALSPLFITAVVRTFSWVPLLSNTGVVNTSLLWLGVIKEPIGFLYRANSPAIYIGFIHVFLPYMILSLMGSLQSIDPSLEEAAKILGAGRWKTFFFVTLPLTIPGILAGSLLVFTLTIASYITPTVLGGGGQKFLTPLIVDNFLYTGNWPFGSAMSIILLVASLLTLVAYSRVILRRYVKTS